MWGTIILLFFGVPVGTSLLILIIFFAVKKKKTAVICLSAVLAVIIALPILYEYNDTARFYMDIGFLAENPSRKSSMPFPKHTRYNWANGVISTYSTDQSVDAVLAHYARIADRGITILAETGDGTFRRVDIAFFYGGSRYTMSVSHGEYWLTAITIPVPEDTPE
ncbi:MAG: hypothetical protein LBQ91_00775 [Oscillospiraceae bacterium]|jgi:hypothetical protein|nr:hypothetical protein [Oscillospiraceae bacterium]